MTMLERMAQAIATKRRDRDQERAVQGGCDVYLLIDPYLPQAREDARSAAEAMKEPTDAMRTAINEFARSGETDPNETWPVWLDAILAEQQA